MDMGHMSDGWNQSPMGQKAYLMYCMSMMPLRDRVITIYINPLKTKTYVSKRLCCAGHQG